MQDRASRELPFVARLPLEQAQLAAIEWINRTWDFKTTRERHINGVLRARSSWQIQNHLERACASGLRCKQMIAAKKARGYGYRRRA